MNLNIKTSAVGTTGLIVLNLLSQQKVHINVHLLAMQWDSQLCSLESNYIQEFHVKIKSPKSFVEYFFKILINQYRRTYLLGKKI